MSILSSAIAAWLIHKLLLVGVYSQIVSLLLFSFVFFCPAVGPVQASVYAASL